jgi:hypothetical protein
VMLCSIPASSLIAQLSFDFKGSVLGGRDQVRDPGLQGGRIAIGPNSASKYEYVGKPS